MLSTFCSPIAGALQDLETVPSFWLPAIPWPGPLAPPTADMGEKLTQEEDETRSKRFLDPGSRRPRIKSPRSHSQLTVSKRL